MENPVNKSDILIDASPMICTSMQFVTPGVHCAGAAHAPVPVPTLQHVAGQASGDTLAGSRFSVLQAWNSSC